MWIEEWLDEEKHGHLKGEGRHAGIYGMLLCIIEISFCYYALGAGNELWLEYVWIWCRIYGLM